MKSTLFGKLCDPAKFYLVLSFFSVVLYVMNPDKMGMSQNNGLGIQVLIMLLWTYILNWVCSMKNGRQIAWFLVFLPFILLSLMLVFFIRLAGNIDDEKLEELKESCSECSL
jgi:hypothetical protein